MKQRRDLASPFGVNLWFEAGEIDDICTDALAGQSCLPADPVPIEIETFIERQFGCDPEYLDLGSSVLGFTQFSPTGAVLRMGTSSTLFEGEGKAGGRRARSTLAHEAGHGLLHASLFIEPPRSDLFPEGMYDPTRRQIMCRDLDLSTGYKGRWWEYQANQAIGGLLLPKSLVLKVLGEFMVSTGRMGQLRLVEQKRENAVVAVANTFEVNPAAARIRVLDLCPLSGPQMEL